MLFYNFDMLNDFIKNNLINNLKIEKDNIEQILSLYDNKKTNLLTITTDMIDMGDFIDKNKLENFHETISSLKNCLERLSDIQSLAFELKKNLEEILSFYHKSTENNSDEIKANLVDYNKQKDELVHKILEFETINTSTLNTAFEFSLTISNKKTKKQKSLKNTILSKDTKKVDIELEPHDNNVLIVSEKEQKAYLPFFYSEIKNIYQNSKYSYKTLQDVVDHLYIIPLNNFKNSSMARFREAFHLIRDKEKGSITKALDLALELMFQYELNPIVIAACRNLDELDIYLDCLEENELYDFPCFQIKFEVMPQLTKNKRKDTFLF